MNSEFKHHIILLKALFEMYILPKGLDFQENIATIIKRLDYLEPREFKRYKQSMREQLNPV